VVECFTLPALRCAWERVLKKDAQDGDISDSPKSSERGRTGPRTWPGWWCDSVKRATPTSCKHGKWP